MGVELLDLSVPITTGMPVYPGDPEVEAVPALTAARDGVNVLRLHMGSQTGTHVDAPFHVDDALPRLDELPLTRFTGPAVVMDVRGLPPRAPIPPDALPPGLEPGDVLVIATGWSEHWGTGGYLAHPYPAPETAEAIVAAGVRTVAVDTLSVDRTPPPGSEEFSLAAHRVLCGAGAVIAENLTGLDRLVAAQDAGCAIEVSLFPIALAGADGAPVRAVARVDDRAVLV
ncbi:cyclase family protein [Actinomadura geliboluensis]|uniref:Cyclase family protein n=1 Tax=Actinomadura geliboluensis TaxID=882440 RepID=A0A5S4H6Q6_9ACTN|nr:cyclase family protein [Actinomadura geliboluensis]TMR40411.1 cyclase family protein [Actinomadura geliboluensis]